MKALSVYTVIMDTHIGVCTKFLYDAVVSRYSEIETAKKKIAHSKGTFSGEMMDTPAAVFKCEMAKSAKTRRSELQNAKKV